RPEHPARDDLRQRDGVVPLRRLRPDEDDEGPARGHRAAREGAGEADEVLIEPTAAWWGGAAAPPLRPVRSSTGRVFAGLFQAELAARQRRPTMPRVILPAAGYCLRVFLEARF